MEEKKAREAVVTSSLRFVGHNCLSKVRLNLPILLMASNWKSVTDVPGLKCYRCAIHTCVKFGGYINSFASDRCMCNGLRMYSANLMANRVGVANHSQLPQERYLLTAYPHAIYNQAHKVDTAGTPQVPGISAIPMSILLSGFMRV